MKSRLRSRAIQAALCCVFVLPCSNPSMAQESDVDVASPSRVTESLISRNELNRLFDQPAPNGNPLRRSAPPKQIESLPRTESSPLQRNLIPQQNTHWDPNFQQATWQEEQPREPTAVSTVAPESDQAALMMGPMPSPEMQSFWSMLDLLLEIPVDKLKQEITERRAAIDSSLGIDEAAKTERLRQLEIAENAAQQATQNVASKAEFQNRVMTINEALESLRLESKKDSEPAPIDSSLPVESMQSLLRNLQAERDVAISNARKITERIQQRDERMARIPVERSQSRSQVNEYHEEFLQRQAAGAEEIETLLAFKARELAASTNVQLLDAEASWHDLSQEKLPLEKSIQQRKLQRLEQEVNSWNEAIANRKQAELEKQIQLAKQSAWETHPALKEFSQETTKLAQARAELAEKIGALQNEKLKVSKQAEIVRDQYDRLETRLRDAGKDESGDLLIEVHRNLIRPYEGMDRVQHIESEKKLTRGTILKLRNEEERVSDPQTFIHDQLKIETDEPVADTTLIAMAEEAIETHRQQLVALVGDNEEYQNLLGEVLPERKQLLKKIAATRELVDTHALWARSADPFSVALLSQSGEGAKEFFDYEQWHDLGDSIIHRVTHRPYECVVGMIGLLVAFVVGRRFKS